jgi:hypothetical protein
VKALFAVAPNFHSDGPWKDRLFVAEGGGWRVPHDDELASLTLTKPGSDPTCCCLFFLPAHMRNRFWAMLNEEAAEGTGNFDEFSRDLAIFLAFKELPPPKDSVSELLIQSPDGKVETGDVWALINFGEEPVLLAWPQLQLRLGPAEGCRMTVGLPPNVVPPPNDELNVLLAIRLGPA